MYQPRRAFGMVGIAVLVILCIGVTTTMVAQEECDAEVEADLQSTHEGTSVTMYEFGVEVRVDNDCARVEYDLIIEELLPNGQTKKIRKPGFAKLNDGSFVAVVEHRMSSDLKMQGYEAKIVKCQVCTIMP